MKHFGLPLFQDLTSDGATQVSVTPSSAPQNKRFLLQAPKTGIKDNYAVGAAMVVRIRVGVDQPAMGGSAINADDLPRVVDSFEAKNQILGTFMERTTFQGPQAYHLIQFVSAGYTYPQGMRAQIAAADGDTSIDLYFVLPFSHNCLARPLDTMPFLGWLDRTELTVYLPANTVLDSLSTGAVLEGTSNLQAWVEYHYHDELNIPVWNQWWLSEVPAAGSTTIIANNVGTAHGLASAKLGERIAGVYWLSDQKGMGGPDGVDNFTSFSCPQLGQDTVVNIDAWLSAYRRLIGGHRGAISGLASGAVLADGAGNPEIVSSSPYAALNTSTLMYLPIRTPGLEQQITKCPKFFGDLRFHATYTANPASGSHRLLFNSFREFEEGKKRELLARAGRPNARLVRVGDPKRSSQGAVLPEKAVG